ncbi:flavin-binding monooxygenase-like family protein [Colletotrichum karsti]|uniref:Flavin-binding monooxygenase-like family protein n=1 Tax=Colletotrichum karsti TaxID=1095194 RepID=A0A9P6LI59_9PEZI|nr:flavin-binding monooxygenase-like family protein [Colletotrichum karsti]KAF9873257.1 flavin-binding monooxygenase-like family protein [Colletotrichum karsti]
MANTTAQDPTNKVDLVKLESVRRKYAEEAKKRLRPEGAAQFLPLNEAQEDRLHSLLDDPWVDHAKLNGGATPISDKQVVRFFVLGAGFGGLLYAVRLIESGVATADEIRLVDAAGGFGGTWYWHRYPGLHCDLESYCYLPLLEETGYIPKQKYAPAAEIREHAERIARRWKLDDKTLFRSDVQRVEWNDKKELWSVSLTERRGPGAESIRHSVQAQYVYLAAGVLTKPQIPKIPGLSSYKGDIFHTSRWDYSVTGGSQEDQTLSNLRDKKVAIIGTAATAIGAIPTLAKYAKELYVIQRTPAYVKPRNQQVTNIEDFQAGIANKKGWQFERQINLNRHMTNAVLPGQPNLVDDGWTDMPAYSAVMGSPSHGIVDGSPEEQQRRATWFHALDLPHMEGVRARVSNIVKDKTTAEKLKPWYPSWCKRPTFSDEYLQAFNESHVHLVDTDGKGPSHATDKAIVVADKEYPADVIIFSTGYSVAGGRTGGSPAGRVGVQVLGREGISMDDKWRQNGPATLHGYATNGFPNLFFSGTSQGTITGNNVFMLGLIAGHVTYMISEAERRVGHGKRAIVEVTREAEEEHSEEIAKRAPFFSSLAGCTPGYFNGHGQAASDDPEEKRKQARGVVWAEGTVSFLNYIGKWRDEGKLKGLSVETRSGLSSTDVQRLSKL